MVSLASCAADMQRHDKASCPWSIARAQGYRMHVRMLLCLLVFGLMTVAACGDDGDPGGSGTGTGAGGPGGSGGQGGFGGQGGGLGGGGGQGGGGPGGFGGQGGGLGGEGGASLGADGAACAADTDCSGGTCATETADGAPSGYCSGACDVTVGSCAGGGVCVATGGGPGVCLAACDGPGDCRDGYGCLSIGSANVCLPQCTDDAQCPTAGSCDVAEGLCAAAEASCSDGADDDDDGATDCADDDCAAACAPAIAAACGDATAAGVSSAGDTAAGTALFAGSCAGDGAPERIYTFTPGAAGEIGVLSIVLQSGTEQGVYVRTACGEPSTELGCASAAAAGVDEQLDLAVEGGVPLSIFVDGAGPGESGPYALTLGFERSICGDGEVSAIEAVAVLGVNTGDTSDGSTLATSVCNVSGETREDIYRYTPVSDGTLALLLSSATDQGLHVRTDCLDADTELGCIDQEFGGTDEALAVDVTGGVPLFIFVDGYSELTDAGPYTLTLSQTP
jgi:hypothetical protein